MEVVLSTLMKEIMADEEAWQQFSRAMRMTIAERNKKKPTVTVNGKTYVVAGSGHEVERSVYMGKTARLTLEVPIQISESFKESGFKDELNKLGIKVINES